jgi:8-oxo-dGTP diphosphatase
MKLRLMAAAFIKCHGRYLMMKRADSRELAPGLWAGIGGHVEPHELYSIETACRREILEETGLTDGDLRNFRLQCIIMRLFRDEEIRQQFIYFAETENETVRDSEEGTLRWIPAGELLDLDLPKTTRSIFSRYFAGMFDRNKLYLGISKIGTGDDAIEWTAIEDFDLEQTAKKGEGNHG